MNATLGTVLSLVIAAIAGVVYPMLATRRKNKRADVTEQSVDSRAVALMFKDERDRLQIRLNAMQTDYESRMAMLHQESKQALDDAKTTWQAQREKDKEQIDELREELQALYKQLYLTRPHEQP